MTDHSPSAWGQLDDDQLGAFVSMLSSDIDPIDSGLETRVRSALDTSAVETLRASRRLPLQVAAALILIAIIATLTIAPVKTAVADWLGIGSTSVIVVDALPSATPVSPPTAAPPGEDRDTVSIQRAALTELGFSLQLPDPELVGPVIGWEIRDTGEGVEIVVAWDQITLTAHPAPQLSVPLQKFVTSVDVVLNIDLGDGTPALWIEGYHVRDTGEVVESVGNTLLWVVDDGDYRLFGQRNQPDTTQIASSFR